LTQPEAALDPQRFPRSTSIRSENYGSAIDDAGRQRILAGLVQAIRGVRKRSCRFDLT